MANQLIFGLHAVLAVLNRDPGRIAHLIIQKDRRDKKMEQLIALAKQHRISIEEVNRDTLDRMTDDANHQGVVAHAKKSAVLGEADLESLVEQSATPPFFLILDTVQDPHNLGACFRTADAAGVTAIIAPKDKAVGITPVVTKVACGATESVPFVQVTNLARSIEKLKSLGVWIYGTDEDGTASLYQTDFKGSIGLVLGAEGEGLRRLTRELCDGLISIPMHGTVSSLNVSVAAGICMYEVVRQRQQSS